MRAETRSQSLYDDLTVWAGTSPEKQIILNHFLHLLFLWFFFSVFVTLLSSKGKGGRFSPSHFRSVTTVFFFLKLYINSVEEEKLASQRQRQRKAEKPNGLRPIFLFFSLARPWHDRAISLIHQGFGDLVQGVSMSFPKTLLAYKNCY